MQNIILDNFDTAELNTEISFELNPIFMNEVYYKRFHILILIINKKKMTFYSNDSISPKTEYTDS